MIESHHRDAQRPPGRQGFPRNLVRIAGFNDVGLLGLQDSLHRLQVDQGPVARLTRDQGGANRVNPRRSVVVHVVVLARHHEDVPVRSVRTQVSRLLGEVAFDPTADW